MKGNDGTAVPTRLNTSLLLVSRERENWKERNNAGPPRGRLIKTTNLESNFSHRSDAFHPNETIRTGIVSGVSAVKKKLVEAVVVYYNR